ncbi:MAG: hypothetical protein LBB72_00655 [Spirochaetaceae bacterium]|nr:hypothetical protein [Spirochaetaceae bacterium]
MILRFRRLCRQGWGAVFVISVFCSACSPKLDITPPTAPPLSRTVLGYGVISVSYTGVMDEPSKSSVTLGYVREKTIVTVLERRIIREEDTLEYWMLIEGNYRGWLPGQVLDVYDNLEKAQTAATSR